MTEELNAKVIAELMLAVTERERERALKSEYARQNREGIHDLDAILAIERRYAPEVLAASMVGP